MSNQDTIPMSTNKVSEIRKRSNNENNTVTVEQIENGFLITKYKETKDKKGFWQYETKKYFSESDPLEGADKQLADYFD